MDDKKEKMDDKNFKMMVGLTFLVITVFMISVSLKLNQKDKGFKITELNEGVGYQICTVSINAPFLYEKEGNIGFQIYQNTTQEQLNKWIEKHPDTIIMQGSVCIGNRLEIRG